MNLIKIIDDLQLDKIDQEEFLKPAMRRGLFKKAGDFSLKAALTSIPFALIAMPKIVKAATSDAVSEALTFALRLEYLEREFYKLGLAAPNLIPSTDKPIFDQIYKHEMQHVLFLEKNLSVPADSKKEIYDFTAGGKFPAFTDYNVFKALAQAFEDTGVRAYKGQAGNVAPSHPFLTAALQIHSVEARHASAIRRLRGIKGWISNNERSTGMPVETQPVYDGEENLTQGGVNITGLSGISNANLTEAFDEPLTMAQVLAVAGLFIK